MGAQSFLKLLTTPSIKNDTCLPSSRSISLFITGFCLYSLLLLINVAFLYISMSIRGPMAD